MLASGRFVATENGTVMHRDIRYKDKRWKPAGWLSQRTRGPGRWVLHFEKKKVLRSRFVARWFHGPIPPGFIVHHKDENPSHDDPINLVVMPDYDHAKDIFDRKLAPAPHTPERSAKRLQTMKERGMLGPGSRPWSDEKKQRLIYEGSEWLERLRKQAPIAARKRYPNCR
jgi:hypothetical protein